MFPGEVVLQGYSGVRCSASLSAVGLRRVAYTVELHCLAKSMTGPT